MPSPFAALILRDWLVQTGWSDDSYAHLTRASRVLLDFVPPRGLSLSVSKAPTASFVNSATLNALAPAHLDGSISYFAASQLALGRSGRIPLRRVLEHFDPGPLPHRPSEQAEYWHRGRRHVERGASAPQPRD